MGTNGSNGTYKDYPEEFRRQILALLVKPSFASRFGHLIKPEYFPLAVEKDLADKIITHRTEFEGKFPTLADIALDMQEDKEYVTNIFKISHNGLHKTEKEVREWAKQQALRLAIIKTVEDWESGQDHDMVDRISKALRTGEDALDAGSNLLSSEWLEDDYTEGRVSTPWPHVDRIIGGGLGPGELGMLLAPTGSFKSTGLVNIGYHAANVVNAKNVLHFTLEMSEAKTLARYAWRTTFKSPRGQDPKEYRAKLLEQARIKLRGKVKVKQYATGQATVRQLHDFISRMIDEGFDPGMIIVDYASLLRSDRQYGQKRFELNEIHQDIRAMGIDFKVPIWSAVQANRQSFSKKVIGTDAVSEDIGISQIADIIISVNQTRDEALVDKVRLHMAKVRDGEGKGIVTAKIKFPAIISTDYSRGDDNGSED